jgi:hypothetical protein
MFEISGLLRESDSLRCVFAEFDPYNPAHYLAQTEFQKFQFRLLLDRNLFGRILSLVSHEESGSVDNQGRVAAAVMAFSIILDILVEPGNAIQELPHEEKRMREELQRFRIIDNLDPHIFAEIALGRRGKIRRSDLSLDASTRGSNVQFHDVKPTGFHMDFSVCLKVATLLLNVYPKQPTVETMKDFLRWMYKDFFFSASVLPYASLALGCRKRKGMFKGLFNGNEIKAIHGVQNATWDAALIRRYINDSNVAYETKEIPVLASFDKALLECASRLSVQEDNGESSEEAARRLFCHDWGENDGIDLANFYLDLLSRADSDGTRQANRISGGGASEYWEDFQQSLEEKLKIMIANKVS